MSFAKQTKQALCALENKNRCCDLSELYGMLRFGGTFSSREIRLQTKCASTAALARTLLQKHFGITDGRTCGGIVLYGQAAALLFGAYHAAGADSVLTIEKIVQCEHCTGAFLRGVFLAVGNLSDPGSAYHLDLCMKNEQTAHALQSFLQKLSMPPKYTVRNREPLLYYKGSEAIEDFLVTVGARRAAFAVMDMKIRKDIRNNTNRVINLEVANLSKSVENGNRQLQAIAKLQQDGRLARLPTALQQTALLRLTHPEATLQMLAQLHDPPLTKSGLNHRLQRLLQLAEQ